MRSVCFSKTDMSNFSSFLSYMTLELSLGYMEEVLLPILSSKLAELSESEK